VRAPLPLFRSRRLSPPLSISTDSTLVSACELRIPPLHFTRFFLFIYLLMCISYHVCQTRFLSRRTLNCWLTTRCACEYFICLYIILLYSIKIRVLFFPLTRPTTKPPPAHPLPTSQHTHTHTSTLHTYVLVTLFIRYCLYTCNVYITMRWHCSWISTLQMQFRSLQCIVHYW